MNRLTALVIALLLAGCGVLPDKKLSLFGEDSGGERRQNELEKSMDGVETASIETSLHKSAIEAEKSGDIGKMGYYYNQLVTRKPDNLLYKYKYAETLRKIGDCKSATIMYDDLLQKEPDNLDYREGKGLCLLADAKFQEAGDIFTKIIKEDSSRWRSINGAGLIFATNTKYQEANQYFDLAVKNSGNNPAVLNNQALLKALVGNTEDAIKILKEASIRASNDIGQKRQIDLNLALVYGIAGKIDMAENTARNHLTEPQLYNNMGVYSELGKDKDLARTYLNKAMMGAPIYYDKAWENLERIDKDR